MPESAKPGSPEDWRNKLLAQLSERAQKVTLLEKYYDGDHPLPKPPKGLDDSTFQEACAAFKNMSRLGLSNWVKLVADAPAERLAVVGFRFGSDQSGDQDAWAMWQANSLDADSALVTDNAIQTGNSFALVFPDKDGKPVITPEHSAQTIVAYQPGSRRIRIAGLKAWEDETEQFAVLYLPNKIYKWRAKKNAAWATATTQKPYEGVTWEAWQPATDAAWPVTHPFGTPLFEFRANPRLKPSLFGGGRGDFESVLTIQDRINKVIFDRLVTAEFQAFRQRYAIGWEPPIDPTTGEVDKRAAFKASQARMWFIETDDAQKVTVGEFAQADFGGFIKAVESDVNAMAAISKTPPHYLLGAMVNISGDALKAAESGLVTRTAKHRDQFSDSWEDVMRTAFLISGDDARAADMSAMTLWRDIEIRTVGEQVDAVIKMQALGVPREVLWSMLPGVTPQDIDRWKQMPVEVIAAQPAVAGAPPVAPTPTPAV